MDETEKYRFAGKLRPCGRGSAALKLGKKDWKVLGKGKLV